MLTSLPTSTMRPYALGLCREPSALCSNQLHHIRDHFKDRFDETHWNRFYWQRVHYQVSYQVFCFCSQWRRKRSVEPQPANAESGAELARSLRVGDAKAYASIEEMVAAPEIDCIWICGPNHARIDNLERIVRRLKSGKGSLIGIACEKPLAQECQRGSPHGRTDRRSRSTSRLS